MHQAPLLQLAPPGGWRTPPQVRLPPLEREQANLWQRLLMRTIERVGKLDAANLWRLLLRNPRLLRGFLSFAPVLMPFGELPRRDTELVILRVAWNCRSQYEWGQHVDIGLRVGLAPDDILRVTQGPAATGWEAREQALLQAVDELHQDCLVSDATWHRLAGHLDERRLLELLMLAGFYRGLAGVLNSAGLPLDPRLQEPPAAFAARPHGGAGAADATGG